MTIKVINKLKEKRNSSKSTSNKKQLQKMINKVEGDYKKGKYHTRKKIKSFKGGLLIIDYGYLSENMKNTLQSVLNHKYNDVLDNFGKADITYSVNFNLINKK